MVMSLKRVAQLDAEFLSYLHDVATPWHPVLHMLWPVIGGQHWRLEEERQALAFVPLTPEAHTINIVPKSDALTTHPAGHALGTHYEAFCRAEGDDKAQGVFYTPSHIIELMFERTPSSKRSPSILDPSCGCGAFLIEHLHRQISFEPSSVLWLQTILHTIYGIDLDPLAITQTRRGVVLALLHLSPDGPPVSAETLHDILTQNIICADALDLEIWANRRFDLVIGNPPYVLVQSHEDSTFEQYAREHYVSARYKVDLYPLFFERGVQWLTDGGWLSMISPKTYLTNVHMRACRAWLFEHAHLHTLIDMHYTVFSDAQVDTVVTIAQRTASHTEQAHQAMVYHATAPNMVLGPDVIPIESWRTDPQSRINLNVRSWHDEVFERLHLRCQSLSEIANAYFGLQTHHRATYVSKTAPAETWQPCVDGGDILPFQTTVASHHVCIEPHAIKSGGNPAVYAQDRLGVRQIGHVPVVGIVPAGTYCLNTVYNVYLHEPNDKQLLRLMGWFNSAVVAWAWRALHGDNKRTFPKVKKRALLSLPVPDALPTSWDKPLARLHRLTPGSTQWQSARAAFDAMVFDHLDLPQRLREQILQDAHPWMYTPSPSR